MQKSLEGILDRLGGLMEAFGAGKVANMRPTWRQDDVQNGTKFQTALDAIYLLKTGRVTETIDKTISKGSRSILHN